MLPGSFYALISILHVEGYGFSDDHVLTVLDQVNGNKVSWPLGAMIFEINAISPVVEIPEISLGASYANNLLSLFLGTSIIEGR